MNRAGLFDISWCIFRSNISSIMCNDLNTLLGVEEFLKNNYFGNVLEMCWKCVGNVLEMCWKCVGNVLEMCWKCVGNVLEMCWKCVGNVLEIFWNFLLKIE